MSARTFGVTLVCGLWFGFALQKSGVVLQAVIRGQFALRDSTLLLVFLAASATSSLACAILKSASATSRSAALQAGEKFLHSKEQGLLAVVLGAATIGAGMAVSGACPSLIYAQIGSGQPTAFVTMAGALTGAGVASAATKPLQRLKHFAAFESRTLGQLLGFSELFAAILIACGAGLLVAAVHLVPGVYSPLPGAAHGISWQYWHPVLGGIMIGATQVPLTLGMSKNLGASSSFAWMVDHVAEFVGVHATIASGEHGQHQHQHQHQQQQQQQQQHASSAWQVVFVACVAAGATLGAAVSETFPQATAWQVQPWEAFVGGFLQLFGSRLASGCAVGHGVTGLGQGSMISAAAAVAMFGGGTLVGVVAYSGLV